MLPLGESRQSVQGISVLFLTTTCKSVIIAKKKPHTKMPIKVSVITKLKVN